MKQASKSKKKYIKPRLPGVDLSQYFALIRSTEKIKCLEGIIKIREAISVDYPEPIIEKIIAEDIVPNFLSFIRTDADIELQYELIWLITNMCAGSSKQIGYLIQAGIVELLIDLLSTDSEKLTTQTFWAIGNIVSDCTEYRDICLDKGLVEKLVPAVEKFGENTELLYNAVRTIRNVFSNLPAPNWDQISSCFPILCKIITTENKINHEIQALALWTVSDIAHINAQAIVDAGCIPRIISHMKQNDIAILGGSLRTLGNLINTASQYATMIIAQPEFLPQLLTLTTHMKKPVRKDVFWIIGSITADSFETAECILNSQPFISALKNALTDNHQRVIDQASLAICNMFLETPAEPIAKLVNEYNMLTCLNKILDNPDHSIQNKALFSIKSIFEVAENKEVQESYRKKIKVQKFAKKLGSLSYNVESDSETADLINTVMLFIDSYENVEFYKLHMKKIKEEGGGVNDELEGVEEEDILIDEVEGGQKEGGANNEDEWEDEEDETGKDNA